MIRATLICSGFVLLVLSRFVDAAETTIPRPEHPRPDAMRSIWANLNGRWDFRFDAQDQGLREGWEKPDAPGFDRTIVVPFPWESELSGIHQPKGAPKVGWYRRRFTVPKEFPADQRVWLRFEAVDWRADVWVNGQKVAEHEGGYTPVRGRYHRRRPARRREYAGRPGVRPDRSEPADRQAGRLVHAQLGHLADRLARGPAREAYIAGFRIAPSLDPARVTLHVNAMALPHGSEYRVRVEAKHSEEGPRFSGVQSRHDPGRLDLVRVSRSMSRTPSSGLRRPLTSTT